MSTSLRFTLFFFILIFLFNNFHFSLHLGFLLVYKYVCMYMRVCICDLCFMWLDFRTSSSIEETTDIFFSILFITLFFHSVAFVVVVVCCCSYCSILCGWNDNFPAIIKLATISFKCVHLLKHYHIHINKKNIDLFISLLLLLLVLLYIAYFLVWHMHGRLCVYVCGMVDLVVVRFLNSNRMWIIIFSFSFFF